MKHWVIFCFLFDDAVIVAQTTHTQKLYCFVFGVQPPLQPASISQLPVIFLLDDEVSDWDDDDSSGQFAG